MSLRLKESRALALAETVAGPIPKGFMKASGHQAVYPGPPMGAACVAMVATAAVGAGACPWKLSEITPKVETAHTPRILAATRQGLPG
jgi:hypothetical protein